MCGKFLKQQNISSATLGKQNKPWVENLYLCMKAIFYKLCENHQLSKVQKILSVCLEHIDSHFWQSIEFLHLGTPDELESAIKLPRRCSIANSLFPHNFTSALREAHVSLSRVCGCTEPLLSSRVCNWNSYWERRELLLGAFIPSTIMQGDSRKKRSGGVRHTCIGNCHHHRTHSREVVETAGEHTHGARLVT